MYFLTNLMSWPKWLMWLIWFIRLIWLLWLIWLHEGNKITSIVQLKIFFSLQIIRFKTLAFFGPIHKNEAPTVKTIFYLCFQNSFLPQGPNRPEKKKQLINNALNVVNCPSEIWYLIYSDLVIWLSLLHQITISLDIFHNFKDFNKTLAIYSI